jgi:hypothetical protein
MTRRAVLRASDADREQIAEQLRRAATEGRLSPDELDERLGSALAAQTYGELDRLVADLPAPSRAPARRAAELDHHSPLARKALAIAVLMAVVFAVGAAIAGPPGHAGHGTFWHGAPVIWLVWIALGWRYFARRWHRSS